MAETKQVPTFTRTAQRPVRPALATLCEHVMGRRQGMPTPQNAEAAALGTAELALVRHVPDAFQLCARIGDHWYPVMTVHAGDPAVKALEAEGRMIAFGAKQGKSAERWPEPTLDEEIAMRRAWGQRAERTGPDERANRMTAPTGPLAPKLSIA